MLKTFLAGKIKLIAAGIFVLALGGLIWSVSSKPKYELVEVARGDVSDEVIVTGKVTPVDNVDLAFEVPGRIARVRVKAGDAVRPGDVLAELDSADLEAALREAEASVLAEKARLDELERGTRPEDIQITRAQLAQAEQDLANAYAGVASTQSDAYSKTDDAVRDQLSSLFSNADGTNPQLTFTPSDTQAQIDTLAGRVSATAELNTWKAELPALYAASSTPLEQSLGFAQARLQKILQFVTRTMDAVISSPSAAATLKTKVIAARDLINTAITNVSEKSQAIASKKIAVEEVKSQLTRKLAGATAEELNTQKAKLAQTEANAARKRIQVAQTALRSPIGGIVGRIDATVGEIATAQTEIASVISAAAFEIEANIPEVDIGTIAVGNPAAITLDAFPNETLAGKVTEIDPAETVIEGVVNFRTVITPKTQERFRSGLTANVAIETAKKTDVLVLPQAALVEKENGTFAKKWTDGKLIEVPLEIGIRDRSGNVEIISGLTDGDKVQNVGLKVK